MPLKEHFVQRNPAAMYKVVPLIFIRRYSIILSALSVHDGTLQAVEGPVKF